MLLLMGFLIWMVTDSVSEAWRRLVLREAGTAPGWRDYGKRLSSIAFGIFLIAYCLRRIRHPSTPGPRWFYVMAAGICLMVLLNVG